MDILAAEQTNYKLRLKQKRLLSTEKRVIAGICHNGMR
jgi:hypothetical protein